MNRTVGVPLPRCSAFEDNYTNYRGIARDPDGDDDVGEVFLLIGAVNVVYSLIDAPVTAHRRNKERERLLRAQETTSWRFRAVPTPDGEVALASVAF